MHLDKSDVTLAQSVYKADSTPSLIGCMKEMLEECSTDYFYPSVLFLKV